MTVVASLAGMLCLSLGAVTERIELSEGWWHTANRSQAYPFTVERMAAWLDDMGRELMVEPGPSQRPPQDPQNPFAEAGHVCKDWEGWKPVRVPHDRALAHGFDYDRSSADGCVDPGVQGWYRRDLDIPASAKGRRVFFECDGAASYAMVWVNGHFVGGWPYAYTPWRVELTPHLDFGGTNTLAVRTAFVPQAARYYTGAGLYRPCHLAFCDSDHLVPGSVAIRTALDGDVAHVAVTYAMSESGARAKTFDVAKPRLWDVNDPYLYEVDVEGERFRYGIRTFAFHADDRRFRLNGRTVPIRGVCLHQDLDVLGAVWNRSAWERRLRKLREAGVNAIRMSHYRHPAGVYDLCDEMGFLVMDEVFDQWSGSFKENDYHRLFPRWHERDLRASIRANRNHPCIVLWGVGNEIVEQRNDLGQFDLALFERNGRALTAIAHEEDPTRPVTTANNNGSVVTSNEVDFVDVYGFNYRWQKFAEHRAARPTRPAVSTETGCYIAGRGEYFFPLKSDWTRTDLHSSSYLNIAICKMEDEWGAHEATTGHAGGFYWTGFDYLGGPAVAPYARRKSTSADPAVASRWAEEIALYGSVRASIRACTTGFFDLAGFPRDVYWQFKARWCPDEPTLHLLPHWNWPERVGEKTPVTAFSSGDEVELFVNGKSWGRRKQKLAGGRFTWDEVIYEPGTLKAVAYRNGERWAETTVETTGPVARLALVPETPTLVADGESVAYVNLSALDAQGRIVPRTRLPVLVTVSGGELVGVENGDDADLTHFKAKGHVVYNGHLSVVVRAKPGETGPIRVTVASEGLPSADCVVPIERRRSLGPIVGLLSDRE